MKIAFLIIAHEYPQGVARLVEKLQSPHADIFIHVDAKKDIHEFKNAIKGKAPFFVSERIKVNHGGFSQPQSILALLKEAVKSGNYDVYQILSGRDYPIKPMEQIIAYYEAHKGSDFIDHYHLTQDAPMAQNIYQYHFVDGLAAVPKKFRPYAVRLKKLLNRVLGQRRFIDGFKPYRGSGWFALSHATVHLIIDFLKTPEGKRYSDFYRFSWGSDEIFFQTLVLHFNTSPIKDYLHYIDWDKARENPAVLDMSDFDRLVQSDKLFTRKVHGVKSAELMDRLDRLN